MSLLCQISDHRAWSLLDRTEGYGIISESLLSAVVRNVNILLASPILSDNVNTSVDQVVSDDEFISDIRSFNEERKKIGLDPVTYLL